MNKKEMIEVVERVVTVIATVIAARVVKKIFNEIRVRVLLREIDILK
jgi:hypothetical protein